MTDWFALLGEPRRPWLDPEALKKKFLQLSSAVHPDRVHAGTPAEKQAAHERYVALNAAYQGLKEPKDRLRHLLQLELGARPAEVEQIQSGMMDLFFLVSQLCRQADALLQQREEAASPLLKVALFEPGQELVEKLGAAQRLIGTKQEELMAELKHLDTAWGNVSADPSRAAPVLQRLEKLYRSFSYFNRWTAQIQERVVQLSL